MDAETRVTVEKEGMGHAEHDGTTWWVLGLSGGMGPGKWGSLGGTTPFFPGCK